MQQNFIPYGTIIETVVGGIKAIITATSIRKNYIEYEISWFNNGDYYSRWVSECEVREIENNSKQPGFKMNNENQTKLIEK
jgi:hypothetical protein